MMDDGQARDTGRLAIAVGLVALASVASLAIFFVVAGPFGTLNDIGNAATGVLSGWLAWRLRGRFSDRRRAPAVALCLVGAAVTVIGSALVISTATGYFLAGLVSMLGFAMIGAWLLALNRSVGATATWSSGLRTLGVATGALMLTGLVSVPGILLGLDDMDTAPGWIWVAFIGWFAVFFAYPIWAIRMGLGASRGATVADRVGDVPARP